MAQVLRIIGINASTYYERRKHQQSLEHTETKTQTAPKVTRGGRPVPGYSYNELGERICDEQIKEWLLELISGEESVYGYRKLAKCLTQEYKLIINKKKVYRLCKELDILRPQRNRHIRHIRRLARNRTVSKINELWEIDIKYGYIAGEDRFFFVMCVIDIYDRMIIDYYIGLTCEGVHAASLLKRALFRRKLLQTDVRPVVRTDNGPQFTCHAFEEACAALSIEHERIPPKTPNMNAHIEAFHRLLEDECLSRHEFESYQEAVKVVAEYIDFYTNRRLHSSLRYMSPARFNGLVAATGESLFTVKV
ncbi:Integrase, catalytic region [Thermosinus carboxydivorans Nor1]|uniref:Integrase, catalytic region n=1 Tax=Thermosinus carboxydivorans Nor1 TaxID=401526 RepID=A1HMN2_9FIRM|nr:IS3 family transposase [Thermosinus carboxydivorans]EAX48522.1 Integrase, catalytic region [Thermosinus carboxydivorans Nor1]